MVAAATVFALTGLEDAPVRSDWLPAFDRAALVALVRDALPYAAATTVGILTSASR